MDFELEMPITSFLSKEFLIKIVFHCISGRLKIEFHFFCPELMLLSCDINILYISRSWCCSPFAFHSGIARTWKESTTCRSEAWALPRPLTWRCQRDCTSRPRKKHPRLCRKLGSTVNTQSLPLQHSPVVLHLVTC